MAAICSLAAMQFALKAGRGARAREFDRQALEHRIHSNASSNHVTQMLEIATLGGAKAFSASTASR